MSLTVWVAANTLFHSDNGGNLWIYLNWALGLRSLGCRVVWLEGAQPTTPPDQLAALTATLQSRLAPYGLADCVALCSNQPEPLDLNAVTGCIDLDQISQADLLINLAYDSCAAAVERCKRSALIDIDPGLLQIWLSEGNLDLPPHDTYFTIGENIGRPGNRTPTVGHEWHHTPPCVALDWWPVHSAAESAAFTTVSNWHTSSDWVSFGDEVYYNGKRSGFQPFFDLPRSTSQPLELALCLNADEDADHRLLEAHGWRVRHADDVAATPQSYQQFVQHSRGEFSCAKPSYVRMENAWVSDRTVCYLASGKPAVVQYTGPSRFLPDAAGMFRFRTLDEAAHHLETVAADYENQCRAARALAEEHFDAAKVARRLLERALA